MDYTAILTNPAAAAQARMDRAAQAARDAAAAEAARNRTTGEVFGDLGTQLLQGAVGLGQSAYGLGNIATLGVLDRATGFSQNFAETNQILEGWKSGPTQAAKARGAAAFEQGIGAGLAEYATDPRLLQDLVVSNIPSLLPAGAGAQFAMRNAAPAVAAKYATTGAARAAGLQSAGSADVEVINAARDAGMTDTQGQFAGIGAGLATGAMTAGVSRLTGAAGLEGAVAARLLGHAAPKTVMGQTVVRGAIGGLAKEGTEEAIQSGAETAIQNAFTGKDITAGVAQSAALGGLAGGLLGGGMGAYASPRRATQQRAEVGRALEEAATAAGVPRPEFELTAPKPPVADPNAPIEFEPSLPSGLSLAEQQAQMSFDFGAPPPARTRGDITYKPADFGAYVPAGVSTVMPMPGYVPPPLIGTTDGEVGTPDQIAATRDLLNDPLYYSEFAKGDKESIPRPPSSEWLPTSQWLPGEPLLGGTPGAQLDLFGTQPMNFGQAMQARKVKTAGEVAAAQAAATQRADEAVAAVQATVGNVTPVQQAIDEQIAARQAGLTERDLVSTEDLVREALFTTHPDGTVTKWNKDLQRNEEVTPAQVDEEVKKASSWKEFMVKTLGLRPGDLQGRTWKAFNDAANEAGVLPVSAQAGEFLNQFAGTIDQDADLPKFAQKFHEAFGVEQAPAAPVPTVAEQLQATAPQAAAPAAAPVEVAPAPAPAPAPVEAAPKFVMARQDKDTHTYTGGKQTVTFRKDLESDLWHWENPATGDSGAFDSPTRASAKENVAAILEERGSAWDTRRQQQGNTDLGEGVTRNKFSAKQFNQEAARALKLAADNVDDDLPHNTYLDYVMQAFDATGSTEALRKAKDHAVKRAGDLFATGDNALTPAGMKQLTTDIASAYNARHDYIVSRTAEGGVFVDDARFSRAGTEGGGALHAVVPPQHTERIQQLVETANNQRSVREAPVQVFETVGDFRKSRPLEPDGSDLVVPSDTKGVYLPDGTVVLITENLSDTKDAVQTILHERTHEGLSGLLGTGVSTVTNRLWANASLRKRIKEKVSRLGLDRTTAAEEVLTDMQENGERLTGDVRAKLKSGIARVFDTLLGSREITVGDADVDALLDDVVRYRTKGVSTPASRMTMPEAMRHIDAMLEGVPDKVTTVRFSRALEELRTIVGDEPVDGPPKNVSRVLGGAARDVAEFVGGLASAVKKGSFGSLPRELYRFAGVPQLHATFGGLWTDTDASGKKVDNAYDRFAEHYAGHADERNRLLHSVREVTGALDALRTSDPDKAKRLNTLIQYSTFYQLYPGRAEQPVAQGIDPVEREQARVQLDRLWKQVGEGGRKIFADVQKAYDTAFRTRYEAVRDNLAKAKGVDLDAAGSEELRAFKKEFGDRIEAQIRKIGHAPYSPLKRFGKYMVDIRDGNKKQVEFTGHDSEAEALKFASDQRARYGSGYSVSATQRSEFNFNLDGVSQELINKIRKGAALVHPVVDVSPTLPAEQQEALARKNSYNTELRAATEEALLDAYLHSIPQHSLMQGANARKYVAGFPLDATRAFNSYMVSYAGNVANIKYGADISKDLADMALFVRKKGAGNDSGIQMMNVLNAVRGQYDGGKKVEFSPVAEKLTMASFVYMMTSPSQMLLNGLQTPLVAAPRMAAQFGTGRSIRALADAGKKWFRKGGLMADPDMPDNVRSVLDELHKTGMDDFTLAHTMAGIAAGKDSDAHTTWRTIMKVASYGMHKSEVFNRQTTAHAFATMLAEKQKGISHDDLLRATKDFIDNQSHFNYDPHNSPEIMQGPWRKAIFQFQNYRLNMLALLARDVKTAEFGRLLTGKDALDPATAKLARTTLAYTVGTQLALTGAVGTFVSPFVFALMDAFRDDDDLLDSRTEFVRGHAQIVSHGLLAALPLIGVDPTRAESGSILPFIGDRQYAPKDKTPQDEFNYYLARAAGPSAGLLSNLWESASAVSEGNYKKALQKALPKPLADAYTAAADFDGVRDSRGAVYFDPSMGDTVKTALGLKSADRLGINEKRGAAYQAETHVKAMAKKALTKVALGYNLGDAELQEEGTARFMGLVQAHPELVKAGMLSRTLSGAAKAQYNADQYGISKSGRISQEVLSAIGE